MRYGRDWRQKAIARHEHITASALSERLKRAADALNGNPGEEPEPPAE